MERKEKLVVFMVAILVFGIISKTAENSIVKIGN
jgi:hypothetical protein